MCVCVCVTVKSLKRKLALLLISCLNVKKMDEDDRLLKRQMQQQKRPEDFLFFCKIALSRRITPGTFNWWLQVIFHVNCTKKKKDRRKMEAASPNKPDIKMNGNCGCDIVIFDMKAVINNMWNVKFKIFSIAMCCFFQKTNILRCLH